MAAVPLSFALAFAVSIHVLEPVVPLFAIAFAVLFGGSLLVPVLLYVDARETKPDAPVRRLLLAGALLPLPTLAYYFRSDPAPAEPGRFAGVAGYLVAATILGWIGYFAGEFAYLFAVLAGTAVPISGTAVLLPGSVGLLLFGAFPSVVYADAKYVRRHGSGWEPSPALRYLGALVFYSPLVLVLPLYACYHLVRRHRALSRGRG